MLYYILALVIVHILTFGSLFYTTWYAAKSRKNNLKMVLNEFDVRFEEFQASQHILPVYVKVRHDKSESSYYLDLTNYGKLALKVRGFIFLDKNMTVVGKIVKEYPLLHPDHTLNFAFKSSDYDHYERLKCVVTIENDSTVEDISVNLPKI
jgi:hypothetical protein